MSPDNKETTSMKRSLILLSALASTLAVTSACSLERQSSVLGPTATVASKSSSATSLLGTWVSQPSSSQTNSTGSAQGATGLPDFSACTNFQWAITNQT